MKNLSNIIFTTSSALILSLMMVIMTHPARSETAVSEKAQRFFDRGTAAIESANRPEDFRAAAEEFSNAYEAEPKWPDPYYNAGVALEKAGDPAGAAKAFRQYLKLAPNAHDAKAVQQKMNKLEYLAEKQAKDRQAEENPSLEGFIGRWKTANNISSWLPKASDNWTKLDYANTTIAADGDQMVISVNIRSEHLLVYKGSVSGTAISGTMSVAELVSDGFADCGDGNYRFEGRIVDRKTILVYYKNWYSGAGSDCQIQDTYNSFRFTR